MSDFPRRFWALAAPEPGAWRDGMQGCRWRSRSSCGPSQVTTCSGRWQSCAPSPTRTWSGTTRTLLTPPTTTWSSSGATAASSRRCCLRGRATSLGPLWRARLGPQRQHAWRWPWGWSRVWWSFKGWEWCTGTWSRATSSFRGTGALGTRPRWLPRSRTWASGRPWATDRAPSWAPGRGARSAGRPLSRSNRPQVPTAPAHLLCPFRHPGCT